MLAQAFSLPAGRNLGLQGVAPQGLQLIGITLFFESFRLVKFERRFRFPDSLVRIGAAPALPQVGKCASYSKLGLG